MRVLSLFSGVGMIDLGLQWAGMEIVGQVEIDPYCRAVLDKHWPGMWRREDVTKVSDNDARALAPDVIAGGFPCQDVSVAGKGKGVEHGERSGLWREFARLVRAARPRWVLAENVPGLRTRGADIVLGDLEAAGYSCWPLVVGAEHVGAPHKRHRVWIVARLDDSKGQRLRVERIDNGASTRDEYALGNAGEARSGVAHTPSGGQRADGRARRGGGHADECEQAVANPGSAGRRAGTGADNRGAASTGRRREEPGASGGCDVRNLEHSIGQRREESHAPAVADRPGLHRWPMPPGPEQYPWEAPRLTQPGVGNATDGPSRRLAGFARRNALKALGNGAVPQVVAEVGRVIVALDSAPAQVTPTDERNET